MAAAGGRACPRAAEKAIWGPATLPDGRSAMDALRRSSASTRCSCRVSWADVAPARPAAPTDPADPAYRWPADVTAAAGEAARRSIQLALLVANSPPWANGGRAADLGADAAAGLRRLPDRRGPPLPRRAPLDDLGRAQPRRPLPAQPRQRPDRAAHLRAAARRRLRRAEGRELRQPGDRRHDVDGRHGRSRRRSCASCACRTGARRGWTGSATTRSRFASRRCPSRRSGSASATSATSTRSAARSRAPTGGACRCGCRSTRSSPTTARRRSRRSSRARRRRGT